LEKQNDVMALRKTMNDAIQQLSDSKETLELLGKQWPKTSADSLKKQAKALTDSLTTMRELFLNKEDVQGIFRSNDNVSSKIGAPSRHLNSAYYGISETHEILMREAQKSLDAALKRLNGFYSKTWKSFENEVKALQVSPFKEWEEIK